MSRVELREKRANQRHIRVSNSKRHAPGGFPSDWDESDDEYYDEEDHFIQSKNTVLSLGPRSIKKRWCNRGSSGWYLRGFYHTIAEWPPPVVLFLYSLTYFVIILVFAGAFLSLSEDDDYCQVGTNNSFENAFLFSAITITTVGYGSYSLFFNGCVGVTVVLTIEILVGFIMNAFLLGLMYTKCARGKNRIYSVKFSSKVMIRQIRGSWYFLFRVGEMRHSQILEAHIRCYCIRDETEAEMLNAGRSVPYMFEQYPMHLNHPDDDLGAPMLLMLPSTIVHRIDQWSPLSHRNFLYIPTNK